MPGIYNITAAESAPGVGRSETHGTVSIRRNEVWAR